MILCQAGTFTAILGHTSHGLDTLDTYQGKIEWYGPIQHNKTGRAAGLSGPLKPDHLVRMIKKRGSKGHQQSRVESERWFEVRHTFVVMLFCTLPYQLLKKSPPYRQTDRRRDSLSFRPARTIQLDSVQKKKQSEKRGLKAIGQTKSFCGIPDIPAALSKLHLFLSLHQ